MIRWIIAAALVIFAAAPMMCATIETMIARRYRFFLLAPFVWDLSVIIDFAEQGQCWRSFSFQSSATEYSSATRQFRQRFEFVSIQQTPSKTPVDDNLLA